jgi:hydroxyethylthiazole kinase-like uncharacterized protein yjeF
MSGATPLDAAWLRRHPLPQPGNDADKNSRGAVLVAGGCREVPGAVLLAGTAALRAGAGRLQLASAASVAVPLALAVPEARVIGLPETEEGAVAAAAAEVLARRGGAADALLLGPGMMGGEPISALLTSLLPRLDGPALVLDGAALESLLRQQQAVRRHAGRVVVTPHEGEMARLLETGRDTVRADPLGAAREASGRLQVITVMKGGCTHIVTPEGQAWRHDAGNAGLAMSGSGDVLAGVIAGLLARGAPPLHAALWGVFLHSEAGRILLERQGGIGFLARDLPAEIPRVLANMAG